MNKCSNFKTCSANICPLDQDVSKRRWMVGEDVCRNKDFEGKPWLRRQRKLNRTTPASLLHQALDLDYLITTAPKKRTLSPEHKVKLLKAAEQFRFSLQKRLS